MGLRYVSSESSRFVHILEQNLMQGKELLNSLTDGSHQLAAAVDGHHLSGAAYTAAKNLFVDLIIPTIQKTSQAIDEIKQELQRYRAAEATVCGESILDEDELKRKIEILKSQQIRMQHTVSEIHHQQQQLLNSHHVVASILHYVDELFNLSQQLTQMANQYGDNIRELERKLKLLQDFGMATQGLFEHSLSNLQLAMQAVTTLNLGTLSADGHFHFPMGLDRSWLTEIKADYPQSVMIKGTIKSMPGAVYGMVQYFSKTYNIATKKLEDNDLFMRAQATYKMYVTETKKVGFLLYGQHGRQTFEELTNKYKRMKQLTYKVNPEIGKKIFDKRGTLQSNFNQTLNKWAYLKKNNSLLKRMNKLDGVKGMAWKTITTHSSKILKASEWVTDTQGKIIEKVVKQLPTLSNKIKPLGKVAKKTGWVGMTLNFGVDAKEAYDELKGEKSIGRRIGKTVVHASVNQLRNAGPIEGAVLLARIHPAGAIVGFGIGVFNMVGDVITPNFKNKIYNGLEHIGDAAVDSIADGINQIGKATNTALLNLKSIFGMGDLKYGT